MNVLIADSTVLWKVEGGIPPNGMDGYYIDVRLVVDIEQMIAKNYPHAEGIQAAFDDDNLDELNTPGYIDTIQDFLRGGGMKHSSTPSAMGLPTRIYVDLLDIEDHPELDEFDNDKQEGGLYD